MKKLLMLCLAFLIAITVSAQDAKNMKNEMQKIKPTTKKLAPRVSKTPAKAPSREMQKELTKKSAKSVNLTAIFAKKRPNTKNTSFIYPKYQAADTQTWKTGKGYITDAHAYQNGYAEHDSYSYDYGEAGSRCWNIVYYKPAVSGTYRVTVEAYQEGRFNLNVSRNGQQAYAYRLVGVNVYGQGYNTKMLEEQYLASKGSKKPAFKNTGSVSKEYYFQAGKTYTLAGYTEVGGWSNGDGSTYYTASAECAIGPFKIEFLRPTK